MKRVFRIPGLPRRKAAAHKGDFGTVLVVAGSTSMAGAAVLCSTGALRAGAGLVRAVVPPAIQVVLAAACPCATTIPRREGGDLARAGAGATAWVMGPGLGTDASVQRMVLDCLAAVAAPLVLDADGLNVLRGDLTPLRERKSPTVITPHPGEAGRLLGRNSAGVQADRPAAAFELVERTGSVVCLKGAGTIVADGARFYVNGTGNPGMATGGTGDVLAGMIGALLAQGMEPFAAAVLAVHVHGIAGDLAARAGSQTGMIASDLLDQLPVAWRRFEGRGSDAKPRAKTVRRK